MSGTLTQQKTKMITQSRIIEEYGWTKSLINKFLPEPTLKKNPYYRSAAPMKVWNEEIVKKVMKTSDFQEAMEKASKRKNAADKAVATKRNNMFNHTEQFINSIKITVLPENELQRRTLYAKQCWYNLHSYGDYCYEKNAHSADDETVNRWIVNYIRHNLVAYDHFLTEIKGKVGSIDAYPEVKIAILQKIAIAYPQYKEECDEQIDSTIMTIKAEMEFNNFEASCKI